MKPGPAAGRLRGHLRRPGQLGGSAFSDIVAALGVAVLLMYMLMMMLFGSLTLPLAVLMSLPLAIVGALGAMALTHTPFTLFSLLGVAVLVGLVGKNAILLVDYTDDLRSAGCDRTDGAARGRPDPPAADRDDDGLGHGRAAADRQRARGRLGAAHSSAAVVLIGGLLTSTLLTLVFVPAMYTIFDDVQALVGRLVRRARGIHPPRARATAREKTTAAVTSGRIKSPTAGCWLQPIPSKPSRSS